LTFIRRCGKKELTAQQGEKTMTKQVRPVPEGYHTATPYLIFQDAAPAIDFYKKAFGATETVRMNGPDGKVSHAEIKIGDSVIMLGSAPGNDLAAPQKLNASTVSVFLYLPDVDSTFKQALSAGAKTAQSLEDMFWGDRFGRLVDPFGHSWSLATHVEDVSPEEMGKRAQALAAKMAAQAKAAG
jgi:PhnB protein